MKSKFIATGIIAASMLTIMSGCGRTDINMNDYLTISYEGYDTIGTASYSIDVEKLISDNYEAFGIEEGDELEALAVFEDIDDLISGELDKKENLTNGDKITFKWDDSNKEDIEDDFKVRLTFEDKTATIDSLEKAQKINPFDYFQLSFEGTAPNGCAVKTVDEKLPVNIFFELDKDSNLNIGDKIKVTASSSGNADDFAAECLRNGYIITETEKEYTVEGIAKYAMAIADIPKESYDKLDSHGKDMLKADSADWDTPESFKKCTLIGNYMLTPKADVSSASGNEIMFIYQIDVENGDTKFSYYDYVKYRNIILLADGTCSFDLSAAETPDVGFFGGDENFKKDDLFYPGYEDLDSLFNNHVTKYIDQFDYESTIK